MAKERTLEVLRIKKYLHGHNQSVLSVKSNNDIFENAVILLQDSDENKVVIKRAGLDDHRKHRRFTLAYEIWQMSITADVEHGDYELEPEESDTDTLTYYLTDCQ